MDGTNVYREGLDVVAMLILGEPGSPVRLLFLRGTRIFVEAILHRQHSTRQVQLPVSPRASTLPTSSSWILTLSLRAGAPCALSPYSAIQSDMEDVLRYVQSVRPLMKTSDSSSESGNGVKRDIRMPASFRERA